MKYMNIRKDVDIATTKDCVIPKHTAQSVVTMTEDNHSMEHAGFKGNPYHTIRERCIIPNWYGSKVSVKMSMIFLWKRGLFFRDTTTILLVIMNAIKEVGAPVLF